MTTLLGIDLGTSSVKVVLVDARFTVLAQAAADYPVHRPHPGWSESDPQQWWNAVVTATRRVLAAGHPAPAAIGLSGQMHGVLVGDAELTPLRPALLWSDARAASELDVYRGLPDEIGLRLGNPLSPGMAGPLLGWLARHEPDVLGAARWALQPKDWIRARLTGEVAAEPSDASATLLFDLTTGVWDLDVADALGVRPELLAPLLPSAGSVAGALQPWAAEALGVSTGIPVAAGAADTAAAAMGSGLHRAGDVQLTIGSGTQIVTPTLAPTAASLRAAGSPVTHTYRGAGRADWYAMAATLNGGLTLDWVRRTVGVTWAELYAAADTAPTDGGDPVFLPYLNGERTPLLDASLTASWIGLTSRHDRTALLRSALAGVADGIADALEALPCSSSGPLTDLCLAGGGSVAPGWRQLLADVLGVRLQALDVPGASALGSAGTASLAVGWYDEQQLSEVLAASTELVAEPRPEHAERHRERREHARALLTAVRSVS